VLEFEVSATQGGFALAARFVAPTPGVTALFGPSGAGKSTVVKAIAGLLPGASGRVCFDGTHWLDSVNGTDVPAERRRVGCVFQDLRLFPHLDVLGNLRYGDRRAPAAGRYATLEEIVALLGLGALLSRRVHQLSGGERQRVALGRALLAQPRLLLLDEPLAALDLARREEVLPYLESLRDRYAIPMLYVSHQYDEVLRLATHIVLLERGRVLANGTPAALGLDPRLRSLIGSEAVGAVLDLEVLAVDAASGLASVALGTATLRFAMPGAQRGALVRVHILARDVILATAPPQGLSVRNALPATLAALVDEGPDAVLATLEVAGTQLLARITRAAVAELGLAAPMPVWALIKAASLRGQAFLQRGAGDAAAPVTAPPP
jgi:molybdate transport system ATP-binding protein